MSNTIINLKAGTRSSRLAVLQARDALDRIEKILPGTKFSVVEFSSPGDRDKDTDLRVSPQDFFTRDLDDAILRSELDCAVHSAKDLPEHVQDGIDWFWLPWREDPRDAIVLPRGKTISDLPESPVAGISSERREAWCLKRFPKARLKNIRGNIQERLDQLDKGDYDIMIMAAAALIRLNLEDRISELISADELPPPEGQGFLAVTFKAGNPLLNKIRNIFVKSVRFAGAGIGHADMCTVAAIKAIKDCDVCLYDSLMPPSLLEYIKPGTQCIDAGKRCGDHHLQQHEITELITIYARQGKRVVRLKGGDPGIFGRLAEEIDALDILSIPYSVIPGITSMQMATTSTGMLLTRRGVSRGFCVMTPRQEGGGIASIKSDTRSQLPIVFFMATQALENVCGQLVSDGMTQDTPTAVIYGAGTENEFTVKSTLGNISSELKKRNIETSLPGLIIVGDIVTGIYPPFGALAGRRILLTCSAALQDKASGYVVDYGGIPIQRPLIQLKPTPKASEAIRNIDSFDWVVITSPSAVRCFMETAYAENIDLRSLPKVMVCGEGTAKEFKNAGILVDAMPEKGFSASAITATLIPLLSAKSRVLRLRSTSAGPDLSEAIRKYGATVQDCILYENEMICYDDLPSFDAVFFASSSALDAFLKQWGRDALAEKDILSIGIPTTRTMERNGLAPTVIGKEATVDSAIATLAEYYVNKSINNGKSTC